MTLDFAPVVEDNKDDKMAPAEAQDLLQNGTAKQSGGDLETEISNFKEHSAYSRRSRGMSLHSVHHFEIKHPTTYTETMINFIKANIGAGTFAMGDAVKNGGLFLGPVLTGCLAMLCVYSQHLLINSSAIMAKRFGKPYHPNYAEAVELSFSVGPPILRRVAVQARKLSYGLLCATQIGFCSVYFAFISSNLKEMLDEYLPPINVHIYMVAVLPLILFTAWIRSLKFLAPLSLIANILMSIAVCLTIYLCIAGGLPPLSERKLVGDWRTMPLFLGTAVFCFEGISMTMPIRNHMKNPKQFNHPVGVLNVGTMFVASVNAIVGLFAYWRFGDDVKGIITLNLDTTMWLAKIVQGSICISILFSYPIQAFVPIEIMWNWVQKRYKPRKHKLLLEYIVRSAIVLFTFSLAESIPRLSSIISLVGAISSTTLSYIFPALMDWSAHWEGKQNLFRHIINTFTLVFAIGVTILGTYASLREIIEGFTTGETTDV